MSGIIIDHEKCILCGQCVDACPADALSFGLGRTKRR